MELALIAIVVLLATRSNDSSEVRVVRPHPAASRAPLLSDPRLVNYGAGRVSGRGPQPAARTSSVTNDRSSTPPGTGASVNPETGKIERDINWQQAIGNCLQSGLPAAGVGAAAAGPAAPAGAAIGFGIGCVGGALMEIVNPTGPERRPGGA